MQKTNKSFTKRLKITKSGKVLARKGGRSHFNAKEQRHRQLDRKRWREIEIPQKEKMRLRKH